MTSSQIRIEPKRRAAIRFMGRVHRKLQRAYAAKPDLTQADIARALGVNRSVVHRQLQGGQDMTLSSVAELAWALGMTPIFDLADNPTPGENVPAANLVAAGAQFKTFASSTSDPVRVQVGPMYSNDVDGAVGSTQIRKVVLTSGNAALVE